MAIGNNADGVMQHTQSPRVMFVYSSEHIRQSECSNSNVKLVYCVTTTE